MPLLGRYLEFRTLRLVMWSPCLRRKHAQSISQQTSRGNLFDELIRLMAGMAPQPARSEQSYADRANSLIESYTRSDLSSGSVLVAHGGHPVFCKAFGPANREWDTPNAPDTKFRIGSVTKQFTASAVLQLVERGTLKLDDPISQYYPDAPASWQMITIRHLLTHMSGIPSYTELPDFPAKMSRIDLSPQEIIKLTQDQPLEFEPGTAYVTTRVTSCPATSSKRSRASATLDTFKTISLARSE